MSPGLVHLALVASVVWMLCGTVTFAFAGSVVSRSHDPDVDAHPHMTWAILTFWWPGVILSIVEDYPDAWGYHMANTAILVGLNTLLAVWGV